MQALSIYFTYGLQCYMPIIILLDQYIMPEADDNRPRGKIYFFWNVMIRLIVTLITCTYISLSLSFFLEKKKKNTFRKVELFGDIFAFKIGSSNFFFFLRYVITHPFFPPRHFSFPFRKTELDSRWEEEVASRIESLKLDRSSRS